MTLHAGARRRRVPADHLEPAGSVVVLTSTVRLSRDLGERHDAEQILAGRSGWPSPQILPFDVWMVRLWQAGLYSATHSRPQRLLHPAAEQFAWEDVVRTSPEGRELLEIPRTAEVALDAWNLMHRWALPPEAAEWRDNEDSEAFLRWAGEFLRRCRSHGWISHAEVAARVEEQIRSGRIPLPEEVIVAGFDDLPPANARVLDALRGRGVQVEIREGWWGGPAESGSPRSVRVGFDRATTEITAAASWARQSLMELSSSGTGDPNPRLAPRIGVIVPDLSEHRERIERAFRDTFSPGNLLQVDSGRRRPFNISLGPRLADYPLIEGALEVLRTDPESIPLEDAGRLIRSPFLGGARREFTGRSLLFQAIRGRREPAVEYHLILDMASDVSRPWHCPELADCFCRWHQVRAAHRISRPPSDWPPVAMQLLDAIGWPGERVLTSVEYQTTEAWREVLSESAGLDSVVGDASWATFVSAIERLTRTRQFQPESDPAPVQILGLLEASGLEFDRLWIMGMDAGAWPRSREPNPFLPISLQRVHQMPDSSPERQLDFARRMCRRLLSSVSASTASGEATASIPAVVVSYPQREVTTGLRPSPLFADLPETSAEEFVSRNEMGFLDQIRLSARMETISDDAAPPWRRGSGPVRGGTRVFADQAACPFRSFARARLGAGDRDPIASGFDAMDRGVLIHDVLDRVWADLETHERLVSLDPTILDEWVRNAANHAIDAMSERRAALRSRMFREVEHSRLVGLVTRWLEIEKSRRAFRVVERESRKSIEIGGVPVVVRVDRVDELDDGSRILIDYKTGPAGLTGWDGARMAEPQLPIYASHLKDEEQALSGVFFAILRKGEEKFRGVAVSDDVIPGVGPRSDDQPLDERIADWRGALESMAAEFRRGWSAVDPMDGPATCKHCNLAGLCRVDAGRREVGSATVRASSGEVEVVEWGSDGKGD